MISQKSVGEGLRRLVLERPLLVVVLSLIPILVAASFIPNIKNDVRSDAFLAADNPALLYRQKIKQQFGLSDPLVIAVKSESDEGIFETDTLALLAWLSDEVSMLANIDSARTISLATEKNIVASSGGMDIGLFFDLPPETTAELGSLRSDVMNFPLYVGNLVSADGKVALVVAEMLDEDLAGESYHSVAALLETASLPSGVSLHVAGEGAIIGYLGEYVDADVKKLVPFSALVITLMLVLAYHSVGPALISNLIVLATLSITVGVMSACDIPFFVITNALPVILIGISVADAVHIYSHYFELQSRSPDRCVKELVAETMASMWRPVTLTSITTMAGFVGLAFAAYMPPFRYFGLFAALGVIVAWFYSLVFLPAMIVLTRPKASDRFLRGLQPGQADLYYRVLSRLGAFTRDYPRVVLAAFLVLAVFGFYATSQLVVDEDPVDVFHYEAPVAVADRVINQHLNGSNTLDVVVEASHSEALFLIENLQKMEALQAYAATLPFVGGSASIVDYLKQLNRAVKDGAGEEYRLPENSETVAQYFLLYAATSDPTDFEEEVDYDYQNANIRIYLNSGNYQDIKVVIESLEEYIAQHFSSDLIKATLSGRVAVNYHWIKDLARSHFVGLAVAILLVLLMSALLFRSFIGGVYTLVPVLSAVLIVYSAMSLSGVALGMGTSMFAAVTVGLGIDFSIHTLERMRAIYRENQGDMDKTFSEFYPTTGRALLFNFLAIAAGFAVLTVSKIGSLQIFGAVVMLAVGASFFASMTLLPALLKVFEPDFLCRAPGHGPSNIPRKFACLLPLVAALALSALFPPEVRSAEQTLSDDEMMEMQEVSAVPAGAAGPDMLSAEDMSEDPTESVTTGDELVALVNAVPEGEFVTREIEMVMTDRRGKQRQRKTVSLRKTYEDQKRTVLFYLAPANVRDTGFLIWDYIDPDEEDNQWLYLPALRKVRRISASDRGDYFLGTDFTYEDMKLDGKLEPRDYNFSLLGRELIDGVETLKLDAVPKSTEIAGELGYSRVVYWINPANWMAQRAEFWDLKERALKTLLVSDIRQVDGIWTRHQLQLENHQTGHQTQFTISEVDYITEVQDDVFTKRALERGR